MFSASLDHAIWFHRPLRADAWHLYDFTCQTYVGGRGPGHRSRLRRGRRARGDHRPRGAAAAIRGRDEPFRPSLTGRQVYDLQITATEDPMTLTSAQPGDVDELPTPLPTRLRSNGPAPSVR